MDIDPTYVIQMGLFLLTLVTVNSILLKPFLKVILAREQATAGAQDEVARLDELSAADMTAYQARMRVAKVTALQEREVLREAGRESERRILAEVRAEIADRLNDARQEVSEAESRARGELRREVPDMARILVQKALGREVTT